MVKVSSTLNIGQTVRFNGWSMAPDIEGWLASFLITPFWKYFHQYRFYDQAEST